MVCQRDCTRQSLHPVPHFASVLHLLPNLCFRTRHSAKSAMMRSKDFRDPQLPLYASHAARLSFKAHWLRLCVGHFA